VAHSSLSPVVAVANYGDRSLSFYTTNAADATISRSVPDIAAPGDMVAVQSLKLYGIGTDVDLGFGPFPASHTPGAAWVSACRPMCASPPPRRSRSKTWRTTGAARFRFS
jgi:hypothetical protein